MRSAGRGTTRRRSIGGDFGPAAGARRRPRRAQAFVGTALRSIGRHALGPVQRGPRSGFGVMAAEDLRHAACLRLFGFAFLSREAFSEAGRAPGPGWT